MDSKREFHSSIHTLIREIATDGYNAYDSRNFHLRDSYIERLGLLETEIHEKLNERSQGKTGKITTKTNQSFNLSIFQSFNLSIFQSFNLSIFQSLFLFFIL